jgi:hypothetical protein
VELKYYYVFFREKRQNNTPAYHIYWLCLSPKVKILQNKMLKDVYKHVMSPAPMVYAQHMIRYKRAEPSLLGTNSGGSFRS